MGVGGPVGAAEYSGVGWAGDVPAVFVDPPVVDSTQEDEVVKIGGSAVGPGDDVVDLEPSGVATSGVLTMAAVAVIDETSQPSRYFPASPADADGLAILADHPFH